MAKRLSRIEYQKQHRRDVFWQIQLPVTVGSLALLTLGVLAGVSLQSGSESAVRWSQISTMWLILPVFLAGFLLLVILVGLIVGVSKLHQILPDYAIVAQDYIQRAATFLQNMTLKSAQPFIGLRSYKAAVEHFWMALQSALSGTQNN